jgi:hypothetical protein
MVDDDELEGTAEGIGKDAPSWVDAAAPSTPRPPSDDHLTDYSAAETPGKIFTC